MDVKSNLYDIVKINNPRLLETYKEMYPIGFNADLLEKTVLFSSYECVEYLMEMEIRPPNELLTIAIKNCDLRMITLLRECGCSLHANTRGYSADAIVRDSGIPYALRNVAAQYIYACRGKPIQSDIFSAIYDGSNYKAISEYVLQANNDMLVSALLFADLHGDAMTRHMILVVNPDIKNPVQNAKQLGEMIKYLAEWSKSNQRNALRSVEKRESERGQTSWRKFSEYDLRKRCANNSDFEKRYCASADDDSIEISDSRGSDELEDDSSDINHIEEDSNEYDEEHYLKAARVA